MNRLRQVHWLARASLAFVFAYHGLVPKLILLSPGEQVLLHAHGLGEAIWLSQAAGVAELVLAALLLMPRLAWPLLVAAGVLLGLLVDVAVMQPSMLVDAFNPVSLNLAGIALCACAWITQELPATHHPCHEAQR
ncbi:DoxX-like family protein [Pseudomonas maumuensis]|uniref:DoxX-like family protein n=1 Tax=Pseudomonas maumuensis TaxID=2842354 RepID=A0ABX8NRU9_9PSED|nr:DoxX-like family protein [Pseudomonas maumuensis]QXH58502.1 DoxX-like family protein [Pseudomonas maumuensis]